jgi:tRNA threonylcarbamoyladenosine biosynthesis protein TsaB
MVILALDTTTRPGSCALMRDGRLLHEESGDAAREQAERLPGDLAALLERESVSLNQIDLLAVATGPGSFTGIRVGIATMQGLAMAIGAPLIGVSALDALAHMASSRRAEGGVHRVAAWIDAWRGEVFAALYEADRDATVATVAKPETLLVGLAGQPVLFTGDGALAHRDAIRTALGVHARFTDPVSPVLAGAVAALAGEAFRGGAHPPPHAITPLYVRRSDAELAGHARPV